MVLDECPRFDPCHRLRMPRSKSRALQTRFAPGEKVFTKPISGDHMTCESLEVASERRNAEKASFCGSILFVV